MAKKTQTSWCRLQSFSCKLTLREVFPSVAKAEQGVILGRMSSVVSFKELGFLSALKEMNSGLQGNNSLCYLNANQAR